jgi:hypothetical protein
MFFPSECYHSTYVLCRENVLLAIDELNGAYNPTMLKSMDKQWVCKLSRPMCHHVCSSSSRHWMKCTCSWECTLSEL